MARVLLLVALALCASAVVADYIYSNDQILELNTRMVNCVRTVPPFSDFDRPSDICRFKGIGALYDGATKEAVPSVVVACLHTRKVAESIVDTVSACLDKCMAEPL